MFFITDSTLFIILYQINSLDLINKMAEICNTFIISDKVLSELSKREEIIGVLGNSPKIQLNIKNNDELFTKLSGRYLQLGPGEISVLCQYMERNCSDDICILDDQKARISAEKLNQTKHGTVWFIEECYRCRVLSKEKALETLRLIRNQNFWIDKKLLVDAIIHISNS